MRKKKWKLHFIDLWWRADRNKLMISIFKEALGNNTIKNFPVVIINTWDRPINKYLKINIFSFSTADWYHDKMVPDWTYDSWMECKIPEFNKIIKEIEKTGTLQPTIDKIWRIWNLNTSHSRSILLNLWKKYPQYLDIKDSNSWEYISLPDLVKTYRYLIDVEWNGFSWRLKYLFFSWRAIFVQERPLNEYALLWAIPYKDYIPVKNDFSDLIEKIEKYFNSDLINKIWKNWQKFATENLNKEKAYKYILNEFINLKKVRFNTLKVTFFVVIFFLKGEYEILSPLILKILGKIKRNR